MENYNSTRYTYRQLSSTTLPNLLEKVNNDLRNKNGATKKDRFISVNWYDVSEEKKRTNVPIML